MKKIVLLVFLLAAPEIGFAAATPPDAIPAVQNISTASEITISGKKGDMLQQVTGKKSEVLNPSQMSVYKAINLLPSLSQQSVDPYGLADIANYHESFRFRGVEPTSGGVPATTVNIEGLPVTGRPGGGITMYDLENFSNITIYSGVMPAQIGLGLADVGGKIDINIRRPENTFGILMKESIGSDNFHRTFFRVDSGALSGGLKSFLSYSDTAADKWKGEGGSTRTNVMAGITEEFSDRMKLETYLTYGKGNIDTYKPLSYAQISNLTSSYKLDYGTTPNSYDYYGYNHNNFEDWMVMANLEIKTGEQSKFNIKPYYWTDKGYYLETVTLPNGQNRIREWDIDHSLKGILTEYTTKYNGIDLDLGYLYHTQERPGPPTSWKLYTVVNGKLVFSNWSLLSNSSSYELNIPFIDAKYRFGDYQLDGGLKYVNLAMPSIITYSTTGIGDVTAAEALAMNPGINSAASALNTQTFSDLFPNVTLTRVISENTSVHASYGENYVTHVDIYPYYISQASSFASKGITFQQLWNNQKMEISQNFEFGMKTKGSNWSIAPTLYYAMHHGKQAVLFDPVLNATYPTTNANADAYGFEMEAEYQPTEKLKCYGSFSWNRFYFTQDVNSDATGSIIKVKGEQVPDAPEFMGKGMISYKTGDITISPIIRYTSVRYGDVMHNEKIDGATLFDLDITWSRKTLGFKNVDCSLSFINIFNKAYVSMISTSDYKTLQTSYQPGAPFTAMATLAFHY